MKNIINKIREIFDKIEDKKTISAIFKNEDNELYEFIIKNTIFKERMCLEYDTVSCTTVIS